MKFLTPIFVMLMLITQTAQANWIGRACNFVFSKIVEEDPSQFEQVRTDALIYYYEQLGIRGAWNKLEPSEAIRMNIMGAELRWRLGEVMIQFESAKNIERIVKAIKLYGDFEGVALYSKDQRQIENGKPSLSGG